MAKKQGTPSSVPKKQPAPEEGRFSINTIKRKLREYQRILTLTRRPTRDEFSNIAKVAALGIILIGIVGFAIYLGMVVAPSYVTNATQTQQTSNASTQTSEVLSESSNTTSNSTSAFTNSTQNTMTAVATT